MGLPTTSENNIVEELEKLAKLHVDGVLSNEEFKTLKAKVLNTLNIEQRTNRVGDQQSKAECKPQSAVSRAATKTLAMKAILLALAIGVVAVATGAFFSFFISLVLHDEFFIKMKPTIVSTIFGITLLVGLTLGKPLLSMGSHRILQLTEKGWRILTLRWGLFFLLLAVLNEIVWRTQSTDTWVIYKIFSNTPLTILFALLQVPLVLKHELKTMPRHK